MVVSLCNYNPAVVEIRCSTPLVSSEDIFIWMSYCCCHYCFRGSFGTFWNHYRVTVHVHVHQSSSSCKGTSGLLLIIGSNIVIFAVIEAHLRLMLPLRCVINSEVFNVDNRVDGLLCSARFWQNSALGNVCDQLRLRCYLCDCHQDIRCTVAATEN